MWDNCYSEYFGAENGVLQGGVASPILFTVYLDELLVRLEKTNVGCYIGHECMEALAMLMIWNCNVKYKTVCDVGH